MEILGDDTVPNCGATVAERGPHQGEVVRPAMIAPEYMGPIVLYLNTDARATQEP